MKKQIKQIGIMAASAFAAAAGAQTQQTPVQQISLQPQIEIAGSGLATLDFGRDSLAVGFRFFLGQQHGVKFEIRDYSYLDSYYENVNRAAAQVSSACIAGTTAPANCNFTGNGALVKNPGITNLVQFDLGYTFIF